MAARAAALHPPAGTDERHQWKGEVTVSAAPLKISKHLISSDGSHAYL